MRDDHKSTNTFLFCAFDLKKGVPIILERTAIKVQHQVAGSRLRFHTIIIRNQKERPAMRDSFHATPSKAASTVARDSAAEIERRDRQ